MNARALALDALRLADPRAKAAATRVLADASTLADIDPGWSADEPPGLPGRPPAPRLVAPKTVPTRSPYTSAGRAALLHAIAHIEFNAVNLALDAMWRFGGMPIEFYTDWLRVAGEEALHFGLLADHLATLGHAYGDFDAHDGLWTMVEKTKHDVLARMALVPRTLEARGLDATPPMQAKLAKAGDARAVEILGVILCDEIGHVAIGNRWYCWLCERAGLDAEAHYPLLAQTYGAPRLRPPFNVAARRAAGFSEGEIARLTAVVEGQAAAVEEASEHDLSLHGAAPEGRFETPRG